MHCTADLYFYTLHDMRTKNSSDAAFLPRGGMPIVMAMLKVAREIIESATEALRPTYVDEGCIYYYIIMWKRKAVVS